MRCRQLKTLVKIVVVDLAKRNTGFEFQQDCGVVLATNNDDVDRINEMASRMLGGETFNLDSFDRNLDDIDVPYPVEVLNSIKQHGIPPHRISVRVGQPLIVMRNIDVGRGICNGTRVLLLQVMNELLKVRLLSGPMCW